MKRIVILLLCFAFLVFGNAGGKAYSQEISLQTKFVDFKRMVASLSFDSNKEMVSGQVSVTFLMLRDTTAVVLDAKNMKIVDKTASFKITATKAHILFKGDFNKDKKYTAIFEYTATPKQTLYFVDNQGSPQLWTQGQGKYTSHWLPSIDDMNDKIEFDINFSDTTGQMFIANGLLTKQEIDYDTVNYKFDLQQPISSYLVALAVGDYKVKKEISNSGVPLEYFYYLKDSLKTEATYRYSKQIFDFLEGEIGVVYPWQVYKQVPVKDFLYAGMENASCTIFSDSFMVDPIGFVDRNYVNVNAHELAHQWFGDLVTETMSDHHWLHEGFATYYALLAEREIFGDDYFYYKLYESAEQLRALSDQGKGQRLVAVGGSSLTYYQKGAWAVHILRELVGEETFAKAVKAYLTKYAYQNVTTQDFMAEVATVTDVNLEEFTKNWLNQTAFQSQEALKSLTRSDFMKQYFELQALRPIAFEQKESALLTAINSNNDYLGQEAVYQLSGEPLNTEVKRLYTTVLLSNNVLMKQTLAQTISNTSIFGLEALLGLVKEESYTTRETVLLQAWLGFREQGSADALKNLLHDMDGQFGFADGNVRTLWLTLSLATPGFKPKDKVAHYQELISYTDPSQAFQLRENAFRYLFQIQSYETQSLKNLLEACVHHIWRFRESARNILKELLNDAVIKQEIMDFRSGLPIQQQTYLSKVF